MRTNSAQADERGPARWMRQRRVAAVKKGELDLTQGHKRIRCLEQCAMKRNEEPLTDGIVDVGEAGDHRRDAGSQERPAEAHGAFDARYRTGGGATGGENHKPCPR